MGSVCAPKCYWILLIQIDGFCFASYALPIVSLILSRWGWWVVGLSENKTHPIFQYKLKLKLSLEIILYIFENNISVVLFYLINWLVELENANQIMIKIVRIMLKMFVSSAHRRTHFKRIHVVNVSLFLCIFYSLLHT